MKKLVLLPVIIMLMSFSQCDKDSFDKKPPVDLTKSYYQDWVGGRPGSTGTLVTLIAKKPASEMVFDSIYFNNKVVKVTSQNNEGQLILTANFINVNPKDRDLILSGDPKEEFGNKPPAKLPEIPFELDQNEAIVSYFVNEKKRYFRVKNISKEKTLYYP